MAVATELFYTASIHKEARLRYWNSVANRVFGAMEVRPASRHFAGSMKRRRFGGVQLIRVESTPVAVEGLPECGLRGVYLLMSLSGRSDISQRGRHARLKAGEVTALCAHEPYLLEADREHVTDVLYLPGSDIDQLLGDHIAVAHPAAECDLLAAFIKRLGGLSAQERAPGNPLQTALDLIALNWPTPRRRSPRVNSEVWECRLREFVEQHLSDTKLGAEYMAQALSISTRYVQMVFARMGTTVSQYVLELRLRVAAERLHTERAMRISDIALETGFSDLSYFCRCFRRRFGVSAREFRAT